MLPQNCATPALDHQRRQILTVLPVAKSICIIFRSELLQRRQSRTPVRSVPSTTSIADATNAMSMSQYIKRTRHSCGHNYFGTHFRIQANFRPVTNAQLLKQALTLYNKDSSKLEQLKRAFQRAENAGCTETNLYKHVHGLFKAIEQVSKEFKVGITQAAAIFYKMWDLGGQEVSFCILH